MKIIFPNGAVLHVPAAKDAITQKFGGCYLYNPAGVSVGGVPQGTECVILSDDQPFTFTQPATQGKNQ